MKNDPVQANVFSEEDVEKFIHAFEGETRGAQLSPTTALCVTKISGILSTGWKSSNPQQWSYGENRIASSITSSQSPPIGGFQITNSSSMNKRAIGFNKINQNGSMHNSNNSWRPSMPETSFRRNLNSVASLALPLALTQLSQHSMSFVDTVFIGRIGELELASTALGSSLFLRRVLSVSGSSMDSIQLLPKPSAVMIPRAHGVLWYRAPISPLFGAF